MGRHTLCGKSLSSVFSFSTPVFINIRDERLGILHWLLLLALAIYVVLWQIFYEGQHLKTEAPLGSVSFQIKRPTVMSDLEYWNASDRTRAITPSDFLPAIELPYCLGSRFNMSNQKPCRYLDEEDIAAISPGVCLISTRVNTMIEHLLCVQPSSVEENCTQLYDVSASDVNSFFVVQPEKFSIMLDHEVFTPTTMVYGKANQPESTSKLVLPDGTKLEPQDGTGFQRLLNRDTISIEQLLAAAGVTNLDTGVTGLFDPSTMRNTGITILLKIKYSNYKPWGFVQTNGIMYEYEVSQGAVYEAFHKTYLINTEDENKTVPARMFENRHGITINVAQIGKLSSFDAVALSVFLASTLALLTVTNVIVDQIALRVFKEGKAYEKAKYYQTDQRSDIAEFMEYRKAQGMGDVENYEDFREELRVWLETRQNKASTPLLVGVKGATS